MKRVFTGLLFALILLYNGAAKADARAEILIEGSTGRVLYANNAEAALPMASTTKIMTALLALELCDLNDTVTAGHNAFGVPGTSIYLSEGESLTLLQMLMGLMLSSGNDAAVAIAEHIGGSVENFCAMMTARARELGCKNTVFLTPHGLPKAGHQTTAHDLALIAREAMKNKTFRSIVATQKASIPWAGHDYERVLTNKNRLLSSYQGATGIKTGYTAAAGRCLVFSAQRDQMELIGVVLNCPDWFDEAEKLLDEGFDEWQMITLLSKDEAVRTLKVENGATDHVDVIAALDVAGPVRLNDWPSLAIDLPETLTAPVEKGQEIGKVSMMDGQEVILTVPLTAAESVPVTSFRTGLDRLILFWPVLDR